jgi:hypothetical protein
VDSSHHSFIQTIPWFRHRSFTEHPSGLPSQLPRTPGWYAKTRFYHILCQAIPINALIVSDLDVELTGETLNHLAVEDVLTEEMGQLSLNAMAGTKVGNSMRLKALVRDKVILIFIESGSPHSCESVLCVPCWFEHNWGYSNTGQGG